MTIWKTQDILIGGKNLLNINFAVIENQVKFIVSAKYFQQSLADIGKSMTDQEKQNVKKTCRNFIRNKLMFLSKENENWVLDYLCSGTFLYQTIENIDALDIKPENDGFFDHENFYSNVNEKNICKEDYENVKHF